MSSISSDAKFSLLRIFKKLQEEFHEDELTKLWHERSIHEIELAIHEDRDPKLGWTALEMPEVTYKAHYKKRRYEMLQLSLPSRSDKPFAFLDYETIEDLDPDIDPSFLVEKSRRYDLLMKNLSEIRIRDFRKKRK